MFFIIETEDTSSVTCSGIASRFAVASTCCRTPSRGPGITSGYAASSANAIVPASRTGPAETAAAGGDARGRFAFDRAATSATARGARPPARRAAGR